MRAVAGVGYRIEAVVPARLLAKSMENRMAKQGGNDTPPKDHVKKGRLVKEKPASL